MKLLQPLSVMKEFDALCDGLSKDYPVLATGLSPIHKAHMIAGILEKKKQSLLVITPDEPSATKMMEDLNGFFEQPMALLFPQKELMLRSAAAQSREYEHERLQILSHLTRKGQIIVASLPSALSLTISPTALQQRSFHLKGSFDRGVDGLVAILEQAGYQRVEQVEGMCCYAVRGGIVDFFSPYLKEPCRIEFWGDEIDSMTNFSIETQRRTEMLDELLIIPAQEALPPLEGTEKLLHTLLKKQKKNSPTYEHLLAEIQKLEGGLTFEGMDRLLPLLYDGEYTLLDHCTGTILVNDLAGTLSAYKDFLAQQQEDIKVLLEEGLLWNGLERYALGAEEFLAVLSKRPSAVLDSFIRNVNGFSPKLILSFTAHALAPWGGDYKILLEEIEGYIKNNYRIVILTPTEKGGQTLIRDLIDDGYAATFNHLPTTAPGTICVSDMNLSAGMEYPSSHFVLITHARQHQAPPKKKKKGNAQDAIRSLSDLEIGNYVVHSAHGIGLFEGIIKKESQGVVKDFIKIRYRGADVLYLPVTQLDQVSKYIGSKDDTTVKLAKLGGADWQKTKQRVRKAVADIASGLIVLYKKRMAAEGYAFQPDNDWQRDFELRFPYNETEDQLRCIQEVKADMEKSRPMDRLLCGDVGFGKTEVAIRAAFKCVMDGKQCAVLVPTTILAWQHYQSFQKRMEGFPVNIELLSRFKTPKQAESLVSDLNYGVVDIVIGTHRLLSKDVRFKDLGLCIIDEEQRFGVTHKERFKELKNSVDVLTLSATPIPRTLNMAMNSIRDMSVIEEPPIDRHPVTTYVMEHDAGIIGEGIRRELRRGGQVFYLHNHVDSIDSCRGRLQEQFPDARIVTAHGKMTEDQLSKIWNSLLEGSIDILVCTTIIETGVDVPNCNTLIIENADHMGLSQLYQLRGRVGRSNRRAYAYLTFRPQKVLTEIATKRLMAIKEMTAFGSGFRIALRDMELRGAGNILGGQQHGHMEAVGYEMYLRLLAEAVAEQQGTPLKDTVECTVDLPINAYIPEEYISNLSQRLDIYKKIAAISNSDQADDLVDELIDRFGDPPKCVGSLLEVALTRSTASALGISEIRERGDLLLLYTNHINPEVVNRLVVGFQGKVMVAADKKPHYAIKVVSDTLSTLRKAFELMSEIK